MQTEPGGAPRGVPVDINFAGWDERFVAIWRRAAKIGWPEHWATDLTHDQRTLAELPPGRSFVWSVRRTGTNLLSHETSPGWTRAVWEQAERSTRWFHWAPEGGLVEMTIQQVWPILQTYIAEAEAAEPVASAAA